MARPRRRCPLRRPRRQTTPNAAAESLEQRIALASDGFRPLLEQAATLVVDQSMGPNPVVLETSEVVGNAATGFVVTAVPAGSVVEKWDHASGTWINISAKPVSGSPSELLSFLANRTIHQGDKVQWRPQASLQGGMQQAFALVSWDDGSLHTEPEVPVVPSVVQNLVVTPTGAEELTLSWNAPSSGVDSQTRYRVQLDTVTLTPGVTSNPLTTSVTTFVTAATSLVLERLDPNAFMTLHVAATNDDGVGPATVIDASAALWTDPACQTPLLPGVTPTELIAGAGPSQAVPVNTWFQFDSVLADPDGRMSFQLPDTGASTTVSGSAFAGSINGLAFRATDTGGFLYGGASNGGVYMRAFTASSNTWSPTWTWVSKPGSGYLGSQSIAQLAVSPDGQFLAVGQGNASNFSAVAVPGNGIQIGRILPTGAIDWLPGVSPELQGKNLRSLVWTNPTELVGTYRNPFDAMPNGVIVAEVDPGTGLRPASQIQSLDNHNTVLAIAPGGHVLAASHDTQTKASRLGFVNEQGAFSILGGRVAEYLQSLNDAQIARVATYPTLVTEPGFDTPQLIAFVGSYRTINGSAPISRVDRLVIDPSTLGLAAFTTQNVEGLVGGNQADNDGLYGNFSFAADPADPTATAVFTGGNTYYPNAGQQRPSGGLVRVTVGSPNATLGFYSQLAAGEEESPGTLGPRVAPGSPHADSRTILFIDTPHGPSLIQSDDGGVWQLSFGTDRSPASSRWRTLAAPGMNTLETLMADYNSVFNAIAGAYQDNGNSLGIVGDHQQLLDSGDGYIALFDDGLASDASGTTTLYYSPQQYLKSGFLFRLTANSSGDPLSHAIAEMKVVTPQGIVPLEEDTTIFSAPIEANAYRSGNVVMAGRFSLYEQASSADSDEIVFRKLTLAAANAHIMSIDNQGSASAPLTSFDSLYAAYGMLDTNQHVNVMIQGRQANPVSHELTTQVYSALAEVGTLRANGEPLPDYLQFANINDVAHRSVAGQPDTVYWLQGGHSLIGGYSLYPDIYSQQVIRYKAADQAVDALPTTLHLAASGIDLAPNDSYQLQSLVYVPASATHGEKLVVGGRSGMWIADIDSSGAPGTFTRMPWSDLPIDGPGSYNVRMKYDPRDDVLVASQLGHGIWLYSFSETLGARSVSSQVVTAVDLHLPQTAEALLNKRGEEVNGDLLIGLNRTLFGDPQTTVYVDLHDFPAWQENMEFVSLFSMAENTVTDETNLLTAAGQAWCGATLLADGSLRVPLTFAAHQTSRSLFVNQREFATIVPTFELDYSVTVADTSFKAEGRVVLESGTPASTYVWAGDRDRADPWLPSFAPAAIATVFDRFGNHTWVRPSGTAATADVLYVGTASSLVTGEDGDDLFIVDASTWGTNWLVGGPGRDEFRLVASVGELPAFPQVITDFQSGTDTIGLAGLSLRDLVFAKQGTGTMLSVRDVQIAYLPNLQPADLRAEAHFNFAS